MKLQLYNVYRRLYYWVETLAIRAYKRLEIWRFSKRNKPLKTCSLSICNSLFAKVILNCG